MSVTKFQVESLETGKSASVDFGSSIINASVAVQGFHLSYGSDDHHVKTIDVKAGISSFSGSKVTVTATCTMEDDSHNKANGTLDILVIAQCDS